MIGYRFLSAAEKEMTEAVLFYDAASRGLGNDFLDDIQQAIQKLREHPHSGGPLVSGLRRKLLHRFPFSVVYALDTDAVLVIAIAHHGRRPGYWTSRVDR